MWTLREPEPEPTSEGRELLLGSEPPLALGTAGTGDDAASLESDADSNLDSNLEHVVLNAGSYVGAHT